MIDVLVLNAFDDSPTNWAESPKTRETAGGNDAVLVGVKLEFPRPICIAGRKEEMPFDTFAARVRSPWRCRGPKRSTVDFA